MVQFRTYPMSVPLGASRSGRISTALAALGIAAVKLGVASAQTVTPLGGPVFFLGMKPYSVAILDNAYADKGTVSMRYCNDWICPHLQVEHISCTPSGCTPVSGMPTDPGSHATRVASVVSSVFARARAAYGHMTYGNYHPIRILSVVDSTGRADAIAAFLNAGMAPDVSVLINTGGVGFASPDCANKTITPANASALASRQVFYFVAAGNNEQNNFTRRDRATASCSAPATQSDFFPFGSIECGANTIPVAQRKDVAVQRNGIPRETRPDCLPPSSGTTNSNEDNISYNIHWRSNFVSGMFAAPGCGDLQIGGSGMTCPFDADQGTSYSAPFVGAALAAAVWVVPKFTASAETAFYDLLYVTGRPHRDAEGVPFEYLFIPRTGMSYPFRSVTEEAVGALFARSYCLRGNAWCGW